MARGLNSFSFSLIVAFLLLSVMIIDLSSVEARPLKSLKSTKDYFMTKQIEGTMASKALDDSSTASAAPGPDGKRRRFQIVQTLKWVKNSGPSPGEGHKIVSAGTNL